MLKIVLFAQVIYKKMLFYFFQIKYPLRHKDISMSKILSSELNNISKYITIDQK